MPPGADPETTAPRGSSTRTWTRTGTRVYRQKRGQPGRRRARVKVSIKQDGFRWANSFKKWPTGPQSDSHLRNWRWLSLLGRAPLCLAAELGLASPSSGRPHWAPSASFCPPWVRYLKLAKRHNGNLESRQRSESLLDPDRDRDQDRDRDRGLGVGYGGPEFDEFAPQKSSSSNILHDSMDWPQSGVTSGPFRRPLRLTIGQVDGRGNFLSLKSAQMQTSGRSSQANDQRPPLGVGLVRSPAGANIDAELIKSGRPEARRTSGRRPRASLDAGAPSEGPRGAPNAFGVLVRSEKLRLEPTHAGRKWKLFPRAAERRGRRREIDERILKIPDCHKHALRIRT